MKKAIRLACMAMVAGVRHLGLDAGKTRRRQGGHAGRQRAAPRSRNASDYVIGSDDQLHITVWKEADFSVDAAGASGRKDLAAADQRYSRPRD